MVAWKLGDLRALLFCSLEPIFLYCIYSYIPLMERPLPQKAVAVFSWET
uniref:Uncharacterized protein n=1 Tax=Siphoviridae sp. cttDR14 TaxID=2826490 RepID=A0A8S5M285_9CAUD|nr:MAG TPA: hypothetical protein [Siphoviridae sp. cttDR14]